MTGSLLAWMQNKQEAAGFLVSGSVPPKYFPNLSPKYSPKYSLYSPKYTVVFYQLRVLVKTKLKVTLKVLIFFIKMVKVPKLDGGGDGDLDKFPSLTFLFFLNSAIY